MPGRDGDVILYFESAPHRRMGEAVLDGNIDLAYAMLVDCIASSAPGLDDPTAGTWYCERIIR